jgi:hypothetical protein
VSQPDVRKAGRCQWSECSRQADVIVSSLELCSLHGLQKHKEERAKRRGTGQTQT